MARRFSLDPTEIVRGLQERAQFLLNADRNVAEVVDILRDTHRILQRFERQVDRIEDQAKVLEERFDDIDLTAKRIDRLEEAVLNIERATLAVEAALGSLPKAVRSRMTRELKPQSPPATS